MRRTHKTGELILFSQLGRMMVRKRYATVTMRKKIIEQWKETYYGVYYHIIPDLNDSDNVLSIEHERTRVRRKYA